MAELESLRLVIADTLEGLGDVIVRQHDRLDYWERDEPAGLELERRGYALWDGAGLLRETEALEVGPAALIERVAELEADYQAALLKCDEADERAAAAQDRELKAKATIKQLKAELAKVTQERDDWKASA